MKVRVEFTVDVDPESWELQFGVDRKEIRSDLREHVRQSTIEYLRQIDAYDGD